MRNHVNRLFYIHSGMAAAAAPAASAATSPLTADDVARWLMEEINNAQELHDDYSLLAEAACHPQFDQLIAHLHRLKKFDADDVGKYMFDNVVDRADLPRMQWVANFFELTAEHICSYGQCCALTSAVVGLDFAKVDWLVAHFGLAKREDLRKWIPHFDDDIARIDEAEHTKMMCHLKTLFGC